MPAQHEPNSQPAMKKLISCAALALCLSGCSPSIKEKVDKALSKCLEYDGIPSYQKGLISSFQCVFPPGSKPSPDNTPSDIQQRACLAKGGEFFIGVSWIYPPIGSYEVSCRFPEKSN